MDALSLILGGLRLESAGYRQFELGAPWAIRFAQAELRGIHIVLDGRCELVVGGQVTPLASGDLVLLPRADPHVLRSRGRRSPPVDSIALAQSTEGIIRNDETGEPARILCGAFVFHRADREVLAALPHVVRIAGDSEGVDNWLRPYVEVLAAEAEGTRAGTTIIMARLSDALIARALRAGAADATVAGWLGALRDARLARALAAIQGGFAEDLSLPKLAKRAGLSRAAFAAQFAAATGVPPMRYLAGVRMRHAQLLLGEGASVAVTADAVGYGSEAAFSAAFRRHTGQAPGAFRRSRGRV